MWAVLWTGCGPAAPDVPWTQETTTATIVATQTTTQDLVRCATADLPVITEAIHPTDDPIVYAAARDGVAVHYQTADAVYGATPQGFVPLVSISSGAVAETAHLGPDGFAMGRWSGIDPMTVVCNDVVGASYYESTRVYDTTGTLAAELGATHLVYGIAGDYVWTSDVCGITPDEPDTTTFVYRISDGALAFTVAGTPMTYTWPKSWSAAGLITWVDGMLVATDWSGQPLRKPVPHPCPPFRTGERAFLTDDGTVLSVCNGILTVDDDLGQRRLQVAGRAAAFSGDGSLLVAYEPLEAGERVFAIDTTSGAVLWQQDHPGRTLMSADATTNGGIVALGFALDPSDGGSFDEGGVAVWVDAAGQQEIAIDFAGLPQFGLPIVQIDGDGQALTVQARTCVVSFDLPGR